MHTTLRNDTPDQLQSLLHAQRSAQLREPLPGWEVRAERLGRLRRLLVEHRKPLAAAIDQDFAGRPEAETELLELFPSLAGIGHALRQGKRWMRPRRRRTGLWFQPGRAELLPQPLGVVGIIVPWNYPLFLAVGPLTAALAAGNRAMLKLSEWTPAFGALFADLISQTFAQDEVAVINGDAQVAGAFSALPFDHLLFTGSTRIGREVMRAASANLTPVTLELGGKSPAILSPDADMEAAVLAIMRGKLFNAGQTCVAPDYVLLPAGQEPRFIAVARAVCQRLHPASRGLRDYASLISERHRQRLLDLLDEARQAGATAHPLLDEAGERTDRKLPPVLVTNAGAETRLMQEEIFGPLLPLVPYAALGDAIAYVNARPRPLALYVFARNAEHSRQVIAQTVAGGVTVNDTLLHIAQDDLPFGGVGESGMGVYHGKDGFDTFSKLKPVFHASPLIGTRLVQPPYGTLFRLMMRLMNR